MGIGILHALLLLRRVAAAAAAADLRGFAPDRRECNRDGNNCGIAEDRVAR